MSISQKSATQTGAQLIVQLLEQQGVELLSGIPGGALLPLYEALGGSSRIAHVLARHEQGAGFIAQGMSRISGKAGVFLATSGPGATNAVTALADAKLDSVPLVCITGQVPRALIGTDAFQEVKTTQITDSVTKANFFVRSAAELADVIPEAFRIAESGRPGPVLVDVPKDVQLEAAPHAASNGAPAKIDAPHAPDEEGIRLAAAMISRAKKPVLYLGGGVVKSHGWEAARRFAEQADLPTVTTLMALGALPSDHPLNLGMLGMHGARYTNRAIDECDLLIAIGARFDDRATGRADLFAPNARIIHIDADRREFGKIKKPTLAIESDARLAIEALLRETPAAQRSDWRARMDTLRRDYPLRMDDADDTRAPCGLIRRVAQLAGPDAAVTTDVGQHQMWVAQAYPFARPDRWLTSGGLGTMGFGLPAAIGAALALPESTPTVCFTGDGSLMMNIQEMATLVDLQRNVKIILLDNAALGMVRQQQTLFYRNRHVGSIYHQPTDLCAVSRAFGIPSIDLGAIHDADGALAEAFATPGPALVRVPVAATRHVLPMVAPGCSNIEVIE